MDPYRPEIWGMNSDQFSAGVRAGWGMECPKCKTADDIYVEATVTIRLYPGGHEAHLCAETIWNDGSPCHCGNCAFAGTAKDFKIPQTGEAQSTNDGRP